MKLNPKCCHQCGSKLTWKKEEGVRRDYCKRCDLFIYRNPLPTAVALCVNSKNEILLIKRGIEPGIGSWALPSGFIEMYEQTDEAALRELYEETGIKGKVVTLLGAFTRTCSYYKSLINVCYLIKKTGGKLTVTPEVQDLGFFPLEKIKSTPFISHHNAIKAYLKWLKKSKK